MTYFWYPYIPFGAVTVLEGIPGAGKTRLAADLILRASNGAPLPGCPSGCTPRHEDLPGGEAMASLYCGYLNQDEIAHSYLYKNDADLNRVAYLCETPYLKLLRKAIQETSARLVVIDPAEYFFDDNPDREKLHQLAAETGVALILTSYNGGINAPSILHIKRGDMALHYLRHLKSPEYQRGEDHAFGIRKDGKIDWLYHCRRISAIGECDLEAEFWEMYAPVPPQDKPRRRRAPERSFPNKRPTWTRV